MKLHDGGTRLAARVASLQASLQSQVTQLRALLPSSAGGNPAAKLNGDQQPQSAPKASAATVPAGNDSGKQAPSGPLTAAPQAKPPTPTKTVSSTRTPVVSTWGCYLLNHLCMQHHDVLCCCCCIPQPKHCQGWIVMWPLPEYQSSFPL